MAAVADVRQAESCHPDQAVDVGLEHSLLVLFASLPEGVAAEPEAGVVDEDVESAELAERDVDELFAALPVRDVELELDLGLQLVDPPRTAGDASTLPGECGRGRRADAARGARDDRGLSLEARHNRRRLTCGCQQSFAAAKVWLCALRLEERLRLRELGVGLGAPPGGRGVLGGMQTRDRLE